VQSVISRPALTYCCSAIDYLKVLNDGTVRQCRIDWKRGESSTTAAGSALSYITAAAAGLYEGRSHNAYGATHPDISHLESGVEASLRVVMQPVYSCTVVCCGGRGLRLTRCCR